MSIGLAYCLVSHGYLFTTHYGFITLFFSSLIEAYFANCLQLFLQNHLYIVRHVKT